MKKIMITIVTISLCLTSLIGCGGKQTAPLAAAPTATEPASMTAASASAASQVQTLTQDCSVPPNSTLTPTKDDSDGDGIPNAAEKVLGTNPYSWDTNGNGVSDKEDSLPTVVDNLIIETSTTALPLLIKDVRVEDNATADHLEITMNNTGAKDLSNFDIYYTITDKVNGTVESYYAKLDGLTVKPDEASTIHFDNDVTQPGHYLGNMNGLYSTSSNGLTFAIQLHAKGYKPLDFTTEKSEGTAEVAD